MPALARYFLPFFGFSTCGFGSGFFASSFFLPVDEITRFSIAFLPPVAGG